MDIEERIVKFLTLCQELQGVDSKDKGRIKELKAGLEELLPTEFFGPGLLSTERAEIPGVKGAFLDFTFRNPFEGYEVVGFYPPINVNWRSAHRFESEDEYAYSVVDGHFRQESEQGVIYVEGRTNLYRPQPSLLDGKSLMDVAQMDERTRKTLAELERNGPNREVVVYKILRGLLTDSFFFPKMNGDVLKDCKDIRVLTFPDIGVVAFRQGSLGKGYLTKFFRHLKLLKAEPAYEAR